MRSVLIIDDEKWTRHAIRCFIPWQEMKLCLAGEAADGQYGLALIEQMRPDIVITDIRMPRMDGIELLEKLNRLQDAPCLIVVSGYDDYSYMRSALRFGSVDYLLKPVEQSELIGALRRCVSLLDARDAQGAPADARPSARQTLPFDPTYFELRREIGICMNAANETLLAGKMEKLRQYFAAFRPGREEVAAVYYSLAEEIQKFSLASLGENAFEGYVFTDASTMAQMLCHMEGQIRAILNKASQAQENRRRLSIAEVKDYMKQHLADASLESVAAHFCVSQGYLSKAFRNYEKESFSDCLIKLRMALAQKLLIEYQAPIKSIGPQVGYSEQANFYKRFRLYFGMTPGEMLTRNNNATGPDRTMLLTNPIDIITSDNDESQKKEDSL